MYRVSFYKYWKNLTDTSLPVLGDINSAYNNQDYFGEDYVFRNELFYNFAKGAITDTVTVTDSINIVFN